MLVSAFNIEKRTPEEIIAHLAESSGFISDCVIPKASKTGTNYYIAGLPVAWLLEDITSIFSMIHEALEQMNFI